MAIALGGISRGKTWDQGFWGSELSERFTGKPLCARQEVEDREGREAEPGGNIQTVTGKDGNLCPALQGSTVDNSVNISRVVYTVGTRSPSNSTPVYLQAPLPSL